MKKSCTSYKRPQAFPDCQIQKRRRRSEEMHPRDVDISCLSNDILHYVLGFFVSESGCVDGQTLRPVSLVSRKWRTVAYSSSLWSIPTSLQNPKLQGKESVNASLAIRENSKGPSPRESLMGFIYIRQLETKTESGTSRFLVKEKATGKECLLSMTKMREKSSELIKEIFQGHLIQQLKFLQPCNEEDPECSEYHRFPRGIRMYEERVVRWYQKSNVRHVTPSADRTQSPKQPLQQTDNQDFTSSISHLMTSQRTAGLVDPARRHVPMDSWAMVVDWIAEVAECFDLNDVAIFQAMGYFDRVISTSELPIKKYYYQLIAGACLWIASKCSKAISCTDICMCSDNSFSANDLVRTEEYVLKQLEWKLAFPTSLGFLEAYGYALGLDKESKSFQMMRYISELALQSPIYLSYEPSMIAACSVVLARFCAQDNELWSDALQHQTDYSFEDLSECTIELSRRLDDIRSSFSHLIIIGRRYRKSTRGCVSEIAIPSISSFATMTAYQQRHARNPLDSVPAS